MTALVALACTLLAGCDFDVPLTKAATQPVNPQLLGNWRLQDEKPDLLSIRRLDDSAYIAAYDHDVYRVFHSETAGLALVTVQDLNGPERKYCYYLWQLSPGGTELTLKRISTKVVPEAVASPEAAQRLIAENRDNPKLISDTTLFVREKR